MGSARAAGTLHPAAPPTPRRPIVPSGRLLLLEDDATLRRAFGARLRREGHVVDETITLAEARAALAGRSYDCLVLDRLVPDGDSLTLVAELHDAPDRPPMLVLSALGEVDERLCGLRAGADDYVAKPVRLDELILRVQNLATRAAAVEWAPICLGAVVLDRDRHRVTVEGRDVHLTPHQYAVLEYLVAHRGRLVTTEELLDHCWDGARSLFTNPLRSQVTRLRKAFAGHLAFDAVRGEGYVLRTGPLSTS